LDECSICGEKRPAINVEHTGREFFKKAVVIRFPDNQPTERFVDRIRSSNRNHDIRTQILVVDGVHYVAVALDSETGIGYSGEIWGLANSGQDYKVYSFQKKQLDCITRDVLSRSTTGTNYIRAFINTRVGIKKHHISGLNE